MMSGKITKAESLCIECQECCKTMAMSLNRPAVTKDMVKFFKARGCELYYIPHVVWVIMPSVCPNLTTFGCKIYVNRPAVCRMYDGRNLPFMDKTCKLHELGGSNG